jgi:signal transduction histidine kinase
VLRPLLPRSLIGQIALVMAIALLIAQAINFTLVLSERQRVNRAQIEGPAIARFVLLVQRLAPLSPDDREEMLPERRHRRGLLSIDAASLVAPEAADPQLVERLREAAQAQGLALREVRATFSDDLPVPPELRRIEGANDLARLERRMRRWRALILSAQLEDGSWVNSRVMARRPDPWIMVRPLVATLLTYLLILAAMVWVAARIARPLRDLTRAAERFQGRGEVPRVEPSGPADLARAINAFNAMGERVSAMLDEKDRMLGAIGHDLRTPLASLRIRAESVEPEEEGERMIATIEEMASMLDDTLALARSGRAVEPLRAVDLGALADAVVEEFHSLGRKVEMEAGERLTAKVQPNLLRRAIRNLIENAVKYAGSAVVAVRAVADGVAIVVSDRGPGIEPGELARVQEAFYRIEPSRSRETGGTGLGLTLARAAAQAHGGSLELENREGGGLTARIVLPREPGAQG